MDEFYDEDDELIIDVDRLRSDLLDYYQSAAFVIGDYFLIEYFSIEEMDDDEVIQKAIDDGYDLSNYLY